MCVKCLSVQSSKHTYQVSFVDNFTDVLNNQLNTGDVITVDSNVLALYQEQLAPVLSNTNYFVVEPSEDVKSYLGIEPFISYLINTGFRKNNRLIAIGGGITQDVTAFTASILFRGVDWFFYPTTLLAQCDSCIGSKTSINFGKNKNQLGNFYPPKMIIIDHRFLDTLTQLDFRSGMGEMLHYYLVSGEDDYQRIIREYDSAFIDKNVLHELIYHTLDFKRSYVEIDEFDLGPRNIFNYGHSFGHAIETLTDYSVPHGIAVTIGMDIANYISFKQGHITREQYVLMQVLFKKNRGDIRLKNISVNDFINALSRDKKNIGSELRVILTKGPGRMFKAPLVITPEVTEWITNYFEESDTTFKES